MRLASNASFASYLTSNEAEYGGLIAGLRLASAAGVRRVVVEGDSLLVVNQLLGERFVIEPRLQVRTRSRPPPHGVGWLLHVTTTLPLNCPAQELHRIALELLARFTWWGMRYIPREDNRAAAELVDEARARRTAVHWEAPPAGLAAVAAAEAAASAAEATATAAAARLVDAVERVSATQLSRIPADLATAAARASTEPAQAAVAARFCSALQCALSAAEAGVAPSEELICRIHAMVLHDDPPAALVSAYRAVDVTGRVRSFCPPAEVRPRMEAYVAELARLAAKASVRREQDALAQKTTPRAPSCSQASTPISWPLLPLRGY